MEIYRLPENFRGVIFEDGLTVYHHASGDWAPIWIPVEYPRSPNVLPVVTVETTRGLLRTADGRKGKRVQLPLKGEGVLVYLSSTRHGRAIVRADIAGKRIGNMVVHFRPAPRSVLIQAGIGALRLGVLFALVYGFVLRADYIPANLPENSMAPTFHLGERIFVLRFPFLFRGPYRGELVVFRWEDPERGRVHLVKRVIAIPGDRVRAENGVIYINGKAVEEPYLSEEARSFRFSFPEVVVPEGRYFVLGDNRPYSTDSRVWLEWGEKEKAFVPREAIIGKPVLVYWPPTHIRIVWSYRLKVD